MSTKTKGAPKRGTKPAATTATNEQPKPGDGIVKLDLTIVESRLAQLPPTALHRPAEGLTLLKVDDKNTVLPALAKFPLHYSRTGRFTGKIMNIAEYCLMKTGLAWNDKHQTTLKEKHGMRVAVLKDDVKATDGKSGTMRKQLSNELDAMRPKFHMACKSAVASFHSRNDVEIRSARIRETAGGIVMDSRAILPMGKTSEADQLRKELAEKNAYVAALENALPPKVVKKLHKKDKAVEVEAEVQTPAEAIAEAAAASPVPQSEETQASALELVR